jgi:hypothetical protein
VFPGKIIKLISVEKIADRAISAVHNGALRRHNTKQIIIYKPDIGGENVTLPLHKHFPIYFVTHYGRVHV